MITTPRLILRPWQEEDLQPYAELNADPKVREYFPSLLTREESDAEVRRFQERHQREGFCLFAAELTSDKQFIGFIGLQTMSFAVPLLQQPAVEIGWRLASTYWGLGLATEGAHAVLNYAFDILHLRQVVAITVVSNHRSRRVMEKIGMKHQPQLDFQHPNIPRHHPLSHHVLYTAVAKDRSRPTIL